MENGLSKYWTPEQEEHYQKLLAGCRTFGLRHLIMTVMDLLKYDGRTKEGKRAIAQGRLRMITATDEDLNEIAKLESMMSSEEPRPLVAERLEELKKERAELQAKGIRRIDLKCR